jgi:amino acid adenylation domain-containing protein
MAVPPDPLARDTDRSVAFARDVERWLADAVARDGEGVAVESARGSLDWRGFAQRVDHRARELAGRGIGPGDRVAIAAERTVDAVVDLVAVAAAGAAYVPLDLDYPDARLRAMLDASAPRAVLGPTAALDALATRVGAVPTLDAPSRVSDPPFAATGALTYVLFTSGSTGRPKGVAMGAGPLANLIRWHRSHPRLGRAARTLQFAPLSFDVHFQEIFSTIACGGTLVLVPDEVRRDPVALREALVARRIERMFLPYVALQMLAASGPAPAPRHLREIVSAGEQLQVTPSIRALLSDVPGVELHNQYGPTETHVVTAAELSGDPAAWPELPPIGRALPHARLAVRTDDGRIVGQGEGELLVGGDAPAIGYIGRPDLTVERFLEAVPGLAGRWYATGDRVEVSGDGVAVYRGRVDQQLKIDGYRIEPGEIESAIRLDPAVAEAVVAGVESSGAGRQLVCFVLRQDRSRPEHACWSELRERIRATLPAYMVPSRFVDVEKVPTTPSGKIDRAALVAGLATGGSSRPASDVAGTIRELWRDLLGVASIDDRANLFDLGARSLLVLRFLAMARDRGVARLSVGDVYDCPTIEGLARAALGDGADPGDRGDRPRTTIDEPVAIVGMATRTADGPDVDAFWSNLVEGREGIRRFAPEELDPSIPQALRSAPNFVAARGAIDAPDRFDAAFFGVSDREALLLDPQQRMLLELSWNALEHAGIDPARVEGSVGVFAGTANNAYAAALREARPELARQAGEFAVMLASEKDYVATRIAHRLDLRGPAVSVHTACSTGLVAAAQACRALRAGECDVALAGGATVLVPQEGGYLHVEGGMESADGRCRPFDAAASGTVFASGGAVVVLKRLSDALRDGDTVFAIVRGVGVNNDGGDKASFTAPSVSGQAAAIRAALRDAGIGSEGIGYVEAHGTGTSLGDPIEVAALARAWGDGPRDGPCWLGSVKGHLGHTIAAAGLLGLIKTALALHHELIPATLHFERPNPQIDFERTPFRVVASTTSWPRGPRPRRAAVSSFGVGGTNAHLVLEEAPASLRRVSNDRRAPAVLVLSGRSREDALARAEALARWLDAAGDADLAPVAATLLRGRRAMAHRIAVAARDAASATDALRRARNPVEARRPARLVFLFPGQGAQFPGMASAPYRTLPAFAEAFDRVLPPGSPGRIADLRRWLLDCAPDDAEAAEHLARTRNTQPALFAMSHALTVWLDSLGVRPAAMIGHSIGEYAAACAAGVLTPEAAMQAVLARGDAMDAQPGGAMLAVRAAESTVREMLPSGVDVAAVNAPELVVVGGPHEAIERFAAHLERHGVGSSRLRVSHAFHSASMDGALPRVAQALAGARLRAPSARYYSCVTGRPVTSLEAVDPEYWARQVRATVRFSDALAAELAEPGTVLVEVGPGQALSSLVRAHRGPGGSMPVVVTLAPVPREGDDAAVPPALAALGALWCHGVDVRWPIDARARRAVLPGYPFRGARYWYTDANRESPEARLLAQAAPLERSSPAASPSAESPSMTRLPRIESELRRLMSDVSGLEESDFESERTWLDSGLDSLGLTQAALRIEQVLGVKLRFRRLLEDLDTPARLASHVDAELPADRFRESAAAPAPSASVPGPAAPVPAVPAWPSGAPDAGGAGFLQELIRQQMVLMSQQIAAVAAVSTALPAAVAPASALVATPRPEASRALEPASPADAAPAPDLAARPFGASARIVREADRNVLSAAQRDWLDRFVARYTARTAGSKSFSQAHRRLMADPRVVTGFNPLWKDLVYPIVADRSDGAYVHDVDGNAYVDLLSCFGANLLGYRPKAVLEALHRQVDAGFEVGPQHPLAAEVAALIARFTGAERVAFCSTGSEAVMGAMRIARTVTGRKTIAIFTNSYHGIFDEVIVRGTRTLRSIAAAPGILASAVENVLVLDFGSDEALEVLRRRGAELAAVMIEPVQNKVPTLRPSGFVRELRSICDEHGCALIFDEVVTGFRVAPGGAQQLYGVQADLATYGKIIGGGLPFAAIAGRTRWMDALDGGDWRYGDDSVPEAGVTYFAGTFVRHPLALAAAHATLLELARLGQSFYDTLAARTDRLVARLNDAFASRSAPVRAVHCASLWRLSWDDGQPYSSLFYYLARERGLHLYEQFGHFVTASMDDAVIDRIVDVFVACVDELLAHGFLTRRASDGEAPLGPGQTERWLAASYDPAAARALVESLCLDLRGETNFAALRDATRATVSRHEAFRLRLSADRPVQRVDPSIDADAALAVIDLSNEADADAALDRARRDACDRPFDLDAAPLARVLVVAMPEGRAVVHVVASHLVFDGWASSVFLRELAAEYRSRTGGGAIALPAPVSPGVFAREELARFEGESGRDALVHWRNVLRDPPEPVSLGDREPSAPRTFAADTLRARFEGATLEALRTRGRRAGTTTFQMLFAAVARTIGRLTGRHDFVVCVPFASQGLQPRGPLIADGVLDLPVRVTLGPDADDDTLLAASRSALLDAMEHPVVTQGTIARALGIESRGDRAPLSGIFFNLNPRLDLSAFAPLVAQAEEGVKPGTLHEAFFNFYDLGDTITLDLHYGTEYLGPTRAAAVLEALDASIRALAGIPKREGAPSTPAVPDLVDTAVETTIDARLLAWNATDRPLDPRARIERSIALQVAATPGAAAVEGGATSLSYAELAGLADRVAHALKALGAGPGRRVGVCLTRRPELVGVLLGILRTGAAYVPLDPGFPADRLAYMVEDAGVVAVVTERSVAERAVVARSRQLRLDDDAQVIEAMRSRGSYEGLDVSSDAPAYVIYTSGSTGRPKGVVVPHGAVCNFLAAMRERPGLRAGERLLAVTTLSFDIAGLELFLPLVVGATVVIAAADDVIDGAALVALLRDRRIGVMQATPTTWHLLLDAGWVPAPGFRALCGGEALPRALAVRLVEAGCELWNLYGPTETTIWSTVARIDRPDADISVGTPIDNTRVWVVDESTRLCPIGEAGELCIAGEGVADGYHGRPDLTADRFVADPFAGPRGGRMYRTGDLGRWREDGTLEHLGRLDFQVKVRGYRIELGEIETCIGELDGVSRVVVAAREVHPGDVSLVAWIVPARGRSIDPQAVRQALRRRLPDYMVPRHVMSLNVMPLLPNGKIDRKALPDPATVTAHLRAEGPGAPRGPSDPALGEPGPLGADEIGAMMASVLGRTSVAPDDDFFRLGGHSLVAAKLATLIAARTGHRPSLRVLFEAPTPRRLAERVAATGSGTDRHEGAEAERPIPRLADRDHAPLSQMQQRVWFLENLTPGTVAHCMPSAHRLVGPLDGAAFGRAFDALVRRHAAMRTVVERDGAGGRQRILPSLQSEVLSVVDLSALLPAERTARLDAEILRRVATPFDLEAGPLFAACLFRLRPDEHVLFFQAHHLIWDAGSFDVLSADLAELYRAEREGRRAVLPEITVEYGDFAAWHNERMAGPELARQLAHWRAVLEPLPRPIDLRGARPRPEEMSGRGGAWQFVLGADVRDALREQARAAGRTLYSALLAAFAMTVHAASGRDEFVVGTPVRGRDRAPLEPLLGFFVNMLPMRLCVNPELPLSRWIDAVHARVVESFASPDVPMDSLMRALKPPRDPGRPPIHQVSFSYQDIRERPVRWGELRHERVPTPILGATQDLGLWCVETHDGVEFVFTFNADILDQDVVSAFGGRIESLLRAMVERPDAPLAELIGRADPGPAKSPVATAVVEVSVAPSGPQPEATLEVVGRIWCRLLAVDAVRPEDNFFDLGGHSLLAIRAVAEMEQAFGVRLPVRRLIFESLEQIAGALDASVRVAAAGPFLEEGADAPARPGSALGRLAGFFGRSGGR